jgi:ADP-heptose:LPS heptosyltransferase
MKVLVMRFSAMGDVAMTLPIFKDVISLNPDVEIHFLSKKQFQPIFENIPNLVFHGLDLKQDFEGIGGFFKLISYVRSISPELILDMHQVLRTSLISLICRFLGVKVFTINKGRLEKKQLLSQKENKKQLPSTFDRYRAVFEKAGLKTEPSIPGILQNYLGNRDLVVLENFDSKKLYVGIAPFAAHETKILPLQKYEAVFEKFERERPDISFLIFGGGSSEKNQINKHFAKFQNVENIIGKYTLKEELSIIQNLKLMVSMDSANMHLGYLAGIPVLSVWGATHSLAGFGLPEDPTYPKLEISEKVLSCRPCSVYGKKPCSRQDHACMQQISSEMLSNAIKSLLSNI